MSTAEQYASVINRCRDIFLKKTADYGTSWRVLRPVSVVDQIFIKAYRIRTIQEVGAQMVNDGVEDEFVGIINYAIIGLTQQELTEEGDEELSPETVGGFYNKYAGIARRLMEAKNHDYGEAWRQMCEESLVDMILMKCQRVRQILRNKGLTLISEGLDANYLDMLNYAVFALILRGEKQEA